MKSPAGNTPGRRIEEAETMNHLYFRFLIMAILDLRVKITIDRQ
jgi:hypothetical protein